MSKKKKIVIAVVVVIIVVAVILAIVMASQITNRVKQEQKLIEEINAITEGDFMSTDIDMTAKTTGDFAVVETTIKEYLQEFKDKCIELGNIYENETVINSMSAENLKEDGPEFTKTKEAITTTREAANNCMADVTTLLEENTMQARIEEKGLNSYYTDLYATLMYNDEETMKDLEETRTQLNDENTKYISMLDKIEQIVTLLSKNSNSWSVNDNGEVEFTSQTVLNQYNELVTELSAIE